MLRLRLHSPECVYAAAVAPGSRAVSEWPPSPWRIASALLAGVSSLEEPQRTSARQAVQRLENAQPPVWWLPPASFTQRPRTWAAAVELASITPGQLAHVLELPQVLPDIKDKRTRYQDRPVRVDMQLPTAWLDVDVDLPEDELHAISVAALRVPYVGRSTHPVELGVLVPDGSGGWVDRTSPSGACDPVLAGPGEQHERWLPNRPGGTPVRCWTPGMVALLDEDYRRCSDNRVGVASHLKGRTVHYAPTRQKTASAWLPVGLRQPTYDVAGTMRSLPTGGGAVLPVVRRDRLVALLCRGSGTVTALQQAWPEGIDTGTRATRTACRFLASASRWSSVVPAAAHPDRRVAYAELARELAEVGDVATLRLRPATGADRPVAGLDAWHVEVTFVAPVRGPLRIGAAGEFGSGMCAAHHDTPGGV